MSNSEIKVGFQEELWGEIDGERVRVFKRHIRTARDAAVPPGQSVEFEFYVAEFPSASSSWGWATRWAPPNGTFQRTRPGGDGRRSVRTNAPSLSSSRGDGRSTF